MHTLYHPAHTLYVCAFGKLVALSVVAVPVQTIGQFSEHFTSQHFHSLLCCLFSFSQCFLRLDKMNVLAVFAAARYFFNKHRTYI